MIDFFKRNLLRLKGRSAARLKVDVLDREAVAVLGPNPITLAKSGLEFREATETVTNRGRVRDLEEQLLWLQYLRTDLGHAWLWTAGLVALVFVEGWGAMTLLKTMGLSPEERRFPAIALALSLIAITKAAASAGSGPSPAASSKVVEGQGPPASTPIPWRAVLVAAAYSLLIAALVVARVFSEPSEDGVSAVSWADAIIALAVTAGPAWMAVYVSKKRQPAVQLAGRIAIAERMLEAAQKQERSAHQYLTTLDRAGARHTEAMARGTAAFSVEQERTSARLRDELVDPKNVPPKP